MFRKAITMVAALAVAAVPIASVADTGSNMDTFFNNSLSSANVTGPTAYQGQSAGYYTMGNVALRGPQETAQIASIQLPSVRAGCGGIDIFTGGFSFISSEQMVAMLKATAQSAVSYAFLLAVKSLSPMIADQMEALAKVAQDINAYNMSSCEAGQALVASVWARSDAATRQICQDLGTNRGIFSDRIASRHGCGSGGKRSETLNALPAADKAVVPVNKNIAWEAIQKHPLLKTDLALSEFMLTLTGTHIIRCPTTTDTAGCVHDVLPAEAKDDKIITKLLDGGTIKGHKCDTTTLCLNPSKFAANVTITPAQALKPRVAKMLGDIVTKIRNRQALSTTEQDFLGMVSLPVYKMANVFAAQQGAYAAYSMQAYADIIALDLLYTWLDRMVGQVEEGAGNLAGVDVQQLTEWRNSTSSIHQYLQGQQIALNSRATALDAMIQRTMQAEQVIAARVGSRVGDAVAFSASLAPK